MIGQTISHYKILEKLGEGGMGVVYKAEDIRLKRPVAIKFLSSQALGTEGEKARFILEARAAAALDHPAICTIHEIEDSEGRTFIVMACIEGYTLQEMLEMGPLNVDHALDIAIQVADGLREAHANGIVHRDIKPSNIMVSAKGQAKITDFGLAKLMGRTSITETGTIMGTVDYMSPEQASGDPIDHRTDIWSLGVVLYQMLTGELPFRGATTHAVIYSIVNEEPKPMAYWQSEIAASLEQVLRNMLQKEPLKRYDDMSALLGDLQLIRKDPAAVLVSEQLAEPFITRRTPFVGRESERQELRRFLERAKNGQGGLVMVGGEPGVGKTRITEELVAEAGRHGFLALTGHCYQMEGAPPYIPFIEILQSIMRLIEPDALLETLGNAAPEAAKLVPELRQQFPDIPDPRKLAPEQERLFLFNNLRDFFERLGNKQPLLFVIEDLHWTDDPTLLLLQHIAQRLQEMPVLVVGTYRDTELDAARSLAKALEELLRQRLAHDVILKRLPQPDVAAMLRGRSGQEPPSRLVKAIYGETEGNPFFVEEVFKHFAEEGKIFDDKGQWQADLKIEELDVPRGVLLVIGHRLERMSEECRRTLTTAAVIGRAFGFQLLDELLDLDEDTVFDAMDEAERAQLIGSTSRGGEAQLMFAHELIRQTLLNNLSTPRRQRLHLRVAEALERLYADTLEQRVTDLAYHFYQAGGNPEKIIDYAVMAAKRATTQTAYEEAVEQYQRALQALEQRQPIDELQRCNLLLALGQAYGDAGDPPRAKETFLKVTEIARRLPVPEQFAEAVVGLCLLLEIFGSVDSQLLSLSNEALTLLPDEDSAVRASLLGRLSYVLEIGEDKRAAGLSEQAIAMARRVGDPEALWYALLARVRIWDRPPEERIADGAELVRLEEEGKSPEIGLEGLNQLSNCYRLQGNITAWNECLLAMEKKAAETQHPMTIWLVRFLKGAQAQLLGRFEEAERLMLEALVLGQKLAEIVPAQGFAGFIFCLRYVQGRLAEMDETFRSQAEQYPDSPMYRGGNMLLHLTMGREEQAREEFERLAGNDFTDLPRDLVMPTLLMGLSTAAAAFGDTRRAALLYDLLRTCHDRLFVIGDNNACWGTRSHYLGLMAATLKRWNDAIAHFEDALELSASIGARPFLARSQHEYAHMLIERNEPGDRDKARTLLTEATATYRELGMPTFLEDAEELLRDL